MFKVIDMSDIKLRSVNNKYNKNFSLNTQYRIFKQILYYNLKVPPKPFKPPYIIKIYKKTYLDIDNTIKAVIDILQGPIIRNDSDVLRLEISKLKRKRGEMSALKVYVAEITMENVKKYFKEIDFL